MILGAMADADPLLNTTERMAVAESRYFKGTTYEELCRIRRELVSTTKEDLLALLPMLEIWCRTMPSAWWRARICWTAAARSWLQPNRSCKKTNLHRDSGGGFCMGKPPAENVRRGLGLLPGRVKRRRENYFFLEAL